MREIGLFVEDYAHQQVIGGLVERLARECGIGVRLTWRNATGGHGKVVGELRTYLRDLQRQGGAGPDLVIVATDANCTGLNDRAREITAQAPANYPVTILPAIPDPHIERWLLLDGSAFRAVFGRGCSLPDMRCERDYYKRLLVTAIRESGVDPSFGGIEYAEDIIRNMNIETVKRTDRSLERFLDQLNDYFRQWQF